MPFPAPGHVAAHQQDGRARRLAREQTNSSQRRAVSEERVERERIVRPRSTTHEEPSGLTVRGDREAAKLSATYQAVGP